MPKAKDKKEVEFRLLNNPEDLIAYQEFEKSTQKIPELSHNPDIRKIDILLDKTGKVYLKDFSQMEIKSMGNKYIGWAWAYFNIWYQDRPQLKDLNTAKIKIWANVVRLIIKQDKRTVDEIRSIYNFMQTMDGNWWFNTIHTIEGVRKHFDKILNKAIVASKVKMNTDAASQAVATYKKDKYLDGGK